MNGIEESNKLEMSNGTDDHNHERLYIESGAAGEIAALAEPVIEDLGFRLVRVVLSGRDGGTLQIMAERSDGTLSIADCTKISRNLSPILDVADPISGNYRLEISSPGIDRPLVRRVDFENWAGQEVKIETNEMIDGRRRFRGILEGVEANEVRLQIDLKEEAGLITIGLPFALLSQAKLLMSDKLLKQGADGDVNKKPDVEAKQDTAK